MSSFPNYKLQILNNNVLPDKVKDILLNSFLKYSLDVGEGFLDFETMSELQQSRDIGLGSFIVSIDGREILLTIDQEMTLMELELSHEEEFYDYEDGNALEIQYWKATTSGDKKAEREAALEWIQNMKPDEFQKRILDGTLPEFERDTENSMPLERTNQGIGHIITDEDDDDGEFNQPYIKRHLLRYISVGDFKMTYYQEFSPYMSMEETMKQIELEAESKVIQGYNSGEIKLPIVSDDGIASLKDPNKQLNFLQNIIAEGAKKFEAAAGRPMSYSEMRQMFG
jgi:hypothetical protein